MLRLLLALLVVANLAFFGWTQGWLDRAIGIRAGGDREPERMLRVSTPERITLLGAGAASGASTGLAAASMDAAAASAGATAARTAPTLATICLEAGPFDRAQLDAAQLAFKAALPGVAWTLRASPPVNEWVVYLGPYPNRAALESRARALTRRGLQFAEIENDAALSPGLSLGHYLDREGATTALDTITSQGVRNARVVALSAPSARLRLRVEADDPARVAAIRALPPDPYAGGFGDCQPP